MSRFRAVSPLPAREFDLLGLFVRLRWAVQAWWFAARIAADDHLGLCDPSGNHEGLNAAMAALTRSS